MAKIYDTVDELIGRTPVLRLHRFEKLRNCKAELFVKIESQNPGGSIKDRAAKCMLDTAEKNGELQKGMTIIEPTSGNTGIGLSLFGAVRGYHTIIVMPDNMSIERIQLMRAFGAEVVLTPAESGMAGCIREAERLREEKAPAWIPGQFTNEANALAHFLSTGPEIYEDFGDSLDAFVAGIGTGGTISGTARYLKSKNPEIRAVGVEPASSPLLTEGKSGTHKIQGIGANFIPEILDRSVIDEVISVSDEEAYEYTRLLAKTEGILSGISGGAALFAALKLSERPEYQGKKILVILPDTGDRYLSAGVF